MMSLLLMLLLLLIMTMILANCGDMIIANCDHDDNIFVGALLKFGMHSACCVLTRILAHYMKICIVIIAIYTKFQVGVIHTSWCNS